jgi:nitrate/nitrite transporter NarK
MRYYEIYTHDRKHLGFLADRIGSYTRVLIVSLVIGATVMMLLLAVPSVSDEHFSILDGANATLTGAVGADGITLKSAPMTIIGDADMILNTVSG